MPLWIRNWWESLRANFWFVPTVMVMAAIGLSFVTLSLDKAVGTEWAARLVWTYTRGPEGARAVLSTVAGSMITIASLTFSIVIIALQLASTQYGPRLLRNFMADRGNQFVLGTFIATFAYRLLVLRSVNDTENDIFVPHLAVTVGLLMALGAVGVLIYFLHHAAENIQSENVIGGVSRDLHAMIDRLYPERVDGEPEVEPDGTLPEGFDEHARMVSAPDGGYVQAIDDDYLMGLARDRDLVLQIVTRPGKFVIEGCGLLKAWPPQRIDDDLESSLRSAFVLGRRRTLTQDVEFAIEQLVEVALRALSPGINDPFTAIACIDRLGTAMAHLGLRTIPAAVRVDDAGLARIVAQSSSYSGLADASFNQIRQASRGNTAVTLHLLETIALIIHRAPNLTLRNALLRHATLIRRGAENAIPDADDRAEVDERFARVLKALGDR